MLIAKLKLLSFMELSPETNRKASTELGENESKRNQALNQFREWIGKHPSLKNTRQGNKKFLTLSLSGDFSLTSITSPDILLAIASLNLNLSQFSYRRWFSSSISAH